MKCSKCGADIAENALFCRECGTRVQAKKKFCRECGSELADGARFCSSCGAIVETTNKDENGVPIVSEANSEEKIYRVNVAMDTGETVHDLKSFGQKNTINFINIKRTKKNKNGLIIIVIIISIILFLLIIGNLGKKKSSESNNVLSTNGTLDIITPSVSKNAVINPGTEYAYMSDAWNVYIAKAVSDNIIKVERWKKSFQSSKTLKYDEDLGSYRITEEQNGFMWIDNKQTAFTLTIQDMNNSIIKKPTSVVFTINISSTDNYKGTDYNEDIACYTYTCDDWHMYRAIALTDTLIKIECWYRTSSMFLSNYCFAWDVGIIKLDNTSTNFEWGGINHSAFAITMQDPQNKSYWKEKKLTSFLLENENYKYSTVFEFLEDKSNLGDIRQEKDGFDSLTNETYIIGRYSIEIPTYWKSERSITDGIQRYAETGGKVSILQIATQKETNENYPVTFDGLMQSNDNMIRSIEASAFSKVTDYEVIDTGNVKGILYKGVIDDISDNLSGYGEWFMYPSEEERVWYIVVFCQTDNTEYLYSDDFAKMIQSIKVVK